MLATLGSAAWQAHRVVGAGYGLDTVPPLAMLFEVMQLHLAAGFGALAGVACGLAARWRLARALLRWLRHASPPTDAGAGRDD
jgi:uncharacterized membrane protein YfcA